jgi:hypothetical protein
MIIKRARELVREQDKGAPKTPKKLGFKILSNFKKLKFKLYLK